MAALKHAPKSELQEEKGMPQKKVRQTISVSTLFKQAPDLKRKAEREVSNVLAPQPAGVLKQRSPMHTRKEYEHPLFLKFLGVTQAYRDGAGRGADELLERVYHELVTRIDDIAVSGAATGEGAHVSNLEALNTEKSGLANPLSEDKIAVQRTSPGGSTLIEERKVSDTMKGFEQELRQKRDEMGQLLRQLDDVNAELVSTKQGILAVEQKDVRKLQRAVDAQVTSLLKQASSSYEATVAEVKKAWKDEQKATKEQQQRFEAFMASI